MGVQKGGKYKTIDLSDVETIGNPSTGLSMPGELYYPIEQIPSIKSQINLNIQISSNKSGCGVQSERFGYWGLRFGYYCDL
jgi:hypothetical protein